LAETKQGLTHCDETKHVPFRNILSAWAEILSVSAEQRGGVQEKYYGKKCRKDDTLLAV
jgi:hypothetical protein